MGLFDGPDSPHPLLLHPPLLKDVSLYTAVNTLVENKIHRVWVIDSGFKPVGVVSLSDVLMSVGNPEVLEAISGMSAACAIL